MKKLFSVILFAAFTALVSCGPSAEEKAAMEKARQDSVAAVQKAIDDSIEAVNQAAIEKARADSAAAADMQKAREDSARAAAKKSVKPKPKTNEQQIEENKKVLQKEKG